MRPIEQAKQARHGLQALCERLQQPSLGSLEASVHDLSAAVLSLHNLEASLKSSGVPQLSSPELAAELTAIRGEIAKARALVSAAGNFFEGLGQLMATTEETGSQYTPQGRPGPILAERAKLVLHG